MGGALTKALFPVPAASYCDRDGLLCYFRRAENGKEVIPGTSNITWLATRTGTEIPAVYIRASGEEKKYTMIMSHSNSEDLGVAIAGVKSYTNELDCDIFCYEYSGYGIATGTPSEENVYADIKAAYDYLIIDVGVDPKSIILFGRGLGSAPSIELARRRPVGGIILTGAFTSILRVATSQKVKASGSSEMLNHASARIDIMSRAQMDMFVNIDKIGKLRCDVLLIHGTADEIVPFLHAQKLHDKLHNKIPPLWLQGAMHSDVETVHRVEVLDRIHNFLKNLQVNDEYPCNHDASASILSLSNLYRGSSVGMKGSVFTDHGEMTSYPSSDMLRKRVSDCGFDRSQKFREHSLFGSKNSSCGRGGLCISQSQKRINSLLFGGLEESQHSYNSLESRSNAKSSYHQGDSFTVTESIMRNIEAVQSILQKKLGADLQPENEFVLRCLRVHKFDPKDAAKLVLRYVKMLAKLGVDGGSGIPFYAVETTINQDIFGDPTRKDREGHPYFVVRANKLFPRLVKWRQALKAMLYMLEDLTIREPESQRQGITVVMDVKGFSLKENFSSDFLYEFLRALQANFPIVIYSVLIVDGTSAFNAALQTLRPILSLDFSKRIQRDVTRKTLQNYIKPSELPTFLGGTMQMEPASCCVDKQNDAPRLRVTGGRVVTSLHRKNLEHFGYTNAL